MALPKRFTASSLVGEGWGRGGNVRAAVATSSLSPPIQGEGADLRCNEHSRAYR